MRNQERQQKELYDWVQAGTMKQWLLGYLTARNRFGVSRKDALGDINTQLVTDWTDQYCNENPKDDLSDAADELFKRLLK